MENLNVTKTELGSYLIAKGEISILREQKPSVRWDKRWMEISKVSSQMTRCPRRGAGATIVRDYRFQVSDGFNGPPIGACHPEERHPEGKNECLRVYRGYAAGDGSWVCPCAHAEGNAISIAAREGGKGTKNCTLYLYTDPPVLPCSGCTLDIIQAGINEVVVNSLEEYKDLPHAFSIPGLFKETKVLLRKPLN